MSLTFLENTLYIDASGFTFGGGGTSIVLGLTLDQRSTIPTSFTSFDIYDVDGSTILSSNFPFTINSLLKNGSSNQNWLLTLTFDQSSDNIKFNFKRKIVLHANTGNTYTLYIIVDYANAYTLSSWTNDNSDITSLTEIDLHEGQISTNLNDRLKALLHTSLDGWNNAKNSIKYYYYKNKYLNDIIDVAVGVGVLPEKATGTITLNANGDISTLLINYPDRSFGNNILITFTYSSGSNYTISRMQKRSGVINPTPIESKIISLLNSFRIDSVDGSNNVIYNLAQVVITRSVNVLTVPFLSDYDSSLPSDSTDTAALAANMLSDFKYYQTNTITGWTVVV